MSLLRQAPSRLAALGVLPLRAPLPPGKKGPRDKGPRKTGDMSMTHATGCGLLKGQEDPPLLPDSEYPDWLWKLLEPQPTASELEKAYEGRGLTLEELKRLYRLKNKHAINEANNLSKK